MSVRCPNCDEHVPLSDELDPDYNAPLCGFCTSPLPGHSDQYRRCSRCGVRYLSTHEACIACGLPGATRKEALAGTLPQRSGALQHAFDLDRHTGRVVCEYSLIDSMEKLRQVISKIEAAPALSIDTETSGLDPYVSKLLLLQIATPDHVYILDMRALDKKEAARLIRPSLEDPRVMKLLHNANFDYKFIKVHLDVKTRGIYDTMLAHSVLSAGTMLLAALQAIAKLYFDFDVKKDLRLSFTTLEKLEKKHLEYAAADAALLFLVYAHQRRQLQKDSLSSIAQLEFDTIEPIAEMELSGLLVDIDKWSALIAVHKEKRDLLEIEVVQMLGGNKGNRHLYGEETDRLSVTSQKRVIAAFAELGVKIEDTKEETLAKIDHPAAKKLLEFREHDKFVAAFGDSFLQLVNPVTNRIHPDFQQYGADTGRLSCRHPNVQQIPASFRACFIAPDGWKVVTCDYSQAELRILAQLSKDPGFCDAFKSGGDLHSITASKMFKVKLADVSKTQRSQAKAINFGLAYGMGASALADRIGVTKDDAEALIKQYFQAYPQVASWLTRAADAASRFGFSETPLGRKRYYDLPNQSDPEYKARVAGIERQGKNTPIQGANADMTKLALRFIFDRLQTRNARIVNTVHDEIVVEAVAAEAEDIAAIVAEEMRRAGQAFITDVPVEVGVIVADTWAK